MNSPEDRRNRLTSMLRSISADEAAGRASKRLSRAVRYDLAVQASDLNGDACRFPACGCAKADCAKLASGELMRFEGYAGVDGAEWDNRRQRSA